MNKTKYSPRAKRAPGKPKAKSATPAKGKERLRPGQLDGLVLSHMRERESELPLSPSGVAKGIDRSSGAVANCLARLAKAKQVRLARKAPRAYDLKGVQTKGRGAAKPRR
jgi:hypothetical protein